MCIDSRCQKRKKKKKKRVKPTKEQANLSSQLNIWLVVRTYFLQVSIYLEADGPGIRHRGTTYAHAHSSVYKCYTCYLDSSSAVIMLFLCYGRARQGMKEGKRGKVVDKIVVVELSRVHRFSLIMVD